MGGRSGSTAHRRVVLCGMSHRGTVWATTLLPHVVLGRPQSNSVLLPRGQPALGPGWEWGWGIRSHATICALRCNAPHPHTHSNSGTTPLPASTTALGLVCRAGAARGTFHVACMSRACAASGAVLMLVFPFCLLPCPFSLLSLLPSASFVGAVLRGGDRGGPLEHHRSCGRDRAAPYYQGPGN